MIEIRPATGDDAGIIGALHVASQKQAYEGIVDQPFLDGLSVPAFAEKWRGFIDGGTRTLLACKDAAPAGFIAYGPARTRVPGDKGVIPRFSSEVYALYVSPEYWRSGAGTALLKEMAQELDAAYKDTLMLWAIKKNTRACAFYEKLGGERVGRQDVTIGNTSVTESAFGWRNLEKILGY